MAGDRKGTASIWWADLASVVAVTLVLAGIVRIVDAVYPLGVVPVLLYVLFVPGYALVSFLFPRRNQRAQDVVGTPGPGGRIDEFTRVILAAALSPVIAAHIGLVIEYSPLGLSRRTIFAGQVIFVIVCVSGAFLRRRAVTPSRRYTGPSLPKLRRLSVRPSIRLVFGFLILTSLLIAGASAAHTALTWQQQEQFTELAILDGNHTDQPVANNYEFDNESDLLIQIENREQHQMNYTLVTVEQRVTADGEPVPGEITELNRQRIERIDHAEMRRLSVDPYFPDGSMTRLFFLLYRGHAPVDPDPATAYREVHIWVGEATDNETN